MKFAQPRASTAGKRFTIALRRAMRITPRAKVTVTQMGSPSGIAATARDTPMLNMDIKVLPCNMPTTPMQPMMPKESSDRCCPSCSGVRRVSISFICAKVLPSSVRVAVLSTTQVALPALTRDPMNTSLTLSEMPTPSCSKGSATLVFSRGSDSPVRLDSSTNKPLHRTMRASAGTRSPLCSLTMSPGTSSSANTVPTRPSLRIT